jgi:hypothetical protein
MRVTYTVGGRTFEMRTFHQRDWIAIRGKLTLLPDASSGQKVSEKQAAIGYESTARMLALCSIKPKIVMEYPDHDPGPDVVPVDDLGDAEFMELITLLSKDSGFTVEAAEEIRPSSATVSVS